MKDCIAFRLEAYLCWVLRALLWFRGTLTLLLHGCIVVAEVYDFPFCLERIAWRRHNLFCSLREDPLPFLAVKRLVSLEVLLKKWIGGRELKVSCIPEAGRKRRLQT